MVGRSRRAVNMEILCPRAVSRPACGMTNYKSQITHAWLCASRFTNHRGKALHPLLNWNFLVHGDFKLSTREPADAAFPGREWNDDSLPGDPQRLGDLKNLLDLFHRHDLKHRRLSFINRGLDSPPVLPEN